MGHLSDLWNFLKGSEMHTPIRADIEPDHVLQSNLNSTKFVADQHYLQVYINEMYLSYEREWYKEYDPMVFVISEYVYDKKTETVPFIVGPSMLKQFGRELPKGMVFSDTRTIGPSPFRGGNFALAVILYKSMHKDYLTEMLTLIENVAKVTAISSMISVYMQTARVVMEGFESILKLQDVVPVIGHRREFSANAGQEFVPGYYVIVNIPDSQLNEYELWVKKGQLFFGSNPENLQPFREADYILYSISQTTERDDISTLPFYPLYEKMKEEAGMATDENWQKAKINLTSLFQSMLVSPDLTSSNAESLIEKYMQDAKRIRTKAVEQAELGRTTEIPEPSEIKKLRADLLQIVNT